MNAVFSVFSPQQWQVLQALDIYRYLTVDQMVQLGISTSPKSIRDKTLFALRQQDCIYTEKIGSFLPDIHHLTKKGHSILAEVEGTSSSAPSNKRIPFSASFAQHRFAQVDFQIALHQWVEKRGDADILLELQDFVRIPPKPSKAPKPVTEIYSPEISKPVIPDGVFAVGLDDGKIALYLAEVHRSSQTKVVADQLVRYFEIIRHELAQHTFGFKVNPIICSIHQQPSVLKQVKIRLNALPEFKPFSRNFVFHDLGNLTEKFQTGWHFADDKAAQPFPSANPDSNAN